MHNMQKVLHVARELQERGYGNLRVIPSLSPSGLDWRCAFLSLNRKTRVYPSNWIQHNYEINRGFIEASVTDITDLFIRENVDFLQDCKGENAPYTEWYREMLRRLAPEELPYAFSDSYSSNEFWETSLGNKIKNLPDEKYI